ncbi:hypothetical protein L6452_03653 [Arctium lappa]|uniref:Uncharacterized protein n=1 Tax=Arctium lappa TaxID=4217 RepID=A0ACB9FPH4_ARCLA|nr:hypothetical protein L6452_03653 [Arctium lappa]
MNIEKLKSKVKEMIWRSMAMQLLKKWFQGNTMYLWDASEGNTSELVTVDDEAGPVTIVKWAPDGRHISVGLNNSDIQLWDSISNRL